MKVAFTSPFVPPEWIAAHGARAERVVPGAPASPPTGAAPRPPFAGVCPYARAFMAEVVSGLRRAEAATAAQAGAAYDAVVVATTCDQMRRAAEWIERNRDPPPGGGAPVFLMNVPATWRNDSPAALYLDELRRLGRFLVALGARPPTDDGLREAMTRHDGRRAEVEDLPPRAALEAAGVLSASGGVAVSDPPAAEGRGGTPVALVGGPLMRGDSVLFDVVERAGGRVALDGTEGGTRTFPAPFDRRRLRRDPLAELVRAYFKSIPDAFRRPDDMLYEWIREETSASGARGVIVRRYAWCDMWAPAHARLREMLALPVLDLHSAGGGAPSDGETRRIEAFMEVLT